MGEILPILSFGLFVIAAHGLWLVAAGTALRRSRVYRTQSGVRQSLYGWAEAKARAEALLAEMLTDDEYTQLKRHGYLEVRSPHIPDRVYRIPRYRDLVEVYEAGDGVMRLCVQPLERVPDGDVVLIHKLMIEGSEQEYLRTANQLPFRRYL